jgi:hypothetical protein
MTDIETASRPSEAAPEKPARPGMLDLVVLVVLLAACAVIYVVVKDPGFSVITGAVVGLFGTWRARPPASSSPRAKPRNSPRP